MSGLSPCRVYVPKDVSPDEAGRRARTVARRFAAGEVLPLWLVERLGDRMGSGLLLKGAGLAAGTPDLGSTFLRDGIARAFLVGEPRYCMIGQLLAAEQPVRAGNRATLTRIEVIPDPEGLDG